jgi:hypothetical protein
MPGEIALIEGVHGNAFADQLGGDISLQIGEGEDKIGASARILGTSAVMKAETAAFPVLHAVERAAWPEADDSAILAEQIKRLDGLFG